MPLRTSISLSTLTAWVALWLSSAFNTAFYQKMMVLSGYHGMALVLFVLASVVLLWAYLNLVFQWLTWGRLARPLLALLMLCSALCAYFINTYGVGIDAGQITNMMETDVLEVRDLLSWQMLAYVLLLGVIPSAILFRVPIQPATLVSSLKARALASALSLFVAGGIAAVYLADYASIFREHREVRHWVVPHNYLAGLKRYYSTHNQTADLPLLTYGEDATKLASSGKPRLWVFVLGETARAESFSLNGYARNTNPELAKLDIQFAPHVAACGTATAVSLPCIFSGMTRKEYDASLAQRRESLLDILQRAGYAVTWIDNNSGCKGTCARVETWPLPENLKPEFCHDGECRDGILAPSLSRFLANKPVQDRVLVLHQEGSHGPAYYRRYPDEFKRFTPTCDSNALQSCTQEQIINTYDNTIAYTDHVLASLIQQLAQQSDYQAALLYVSDHGESTGEHGLYLHGAPYLLAPDQQTKVPLLTWFGQDWADRPAPSCLSQHMQGLSHDHVFHTVLGWLGVQSAVYNPALDWQRPCRASAQDLHAS